MILFIRYIQATSAAIALSLLVATATINAAASNSSDYVEDTHLSVLHRLKASMPSLSRFDQPPAVATAAPAPAPAAPARAAIGVAVGGAVDALNAAAAAAAREGDPAGDAGVRRPAAAIAAAASTGDPAGRRGGSLPAAAAPAAPARAAIGAGVGDEVAAANAAAASTGDPVGGAGVGGNFLTGLRRTVPGGHRRVGLSVEEEAAAAAAAANPNPVVLQADNKNIAQKAWNVVVAAFCVAVAGVQNHKVTTGASVATVVSVGATYARLNVMFKAASPAVKAAGFKAFAKAELKKAFSRDAKADKYVTAGVVATLISAAATVGSVTLHETGLGAKGCSSVVRGWNALPKRPAAASAVAGSVEPASVLASAAPVELE